MYFHLYVLHYFYFFQGGIPLTIMCIVYAPAKHDHIHGFYRKVDHNYCFEKIHFFVAYRLAVWCLYKQAHLGRMAF